MNRKCRVGVILPEVFHGGAETQFRMLIENMDKSRFDVTVFVERSYNVVRSEAADRWTAKLDGKARVVTFRDLRTNSGNALRLISALRLWLKMMPFLRRRELDTVLVYSALGMRMTPLLRLFGVFTIFSERNSGDYSRFDRLRKLIYFSAADVIVCNSSAAARKLSEYGYRPLTINNAVALGESRPRNDQAIVRTMTLVVPGRIAPVKNQSLLIEALPALNGTVSRIYLAGPVEDNRYMRDLQQSLSLSHSDIEVEFLGFVEDMDALYAECDLVVLPSRAEGMPNVLLEALAREIPCIASDIPSNRAVLADDLMLFGVDDAESLAAAVRHVAQLAPDDVRSMTAAYRRRIAEHFSVRAMVTAYENLFMRQCGVT